MLSIAPFVRGIAFVVFCGPWVPIDWGIKWADRDKNAASLAHARKLIDTYGPDTLVLEDYAGRGSRRSTRVARLIEAIDREARKRKIAVQRYSRGQVQSGFADFGARTKQEIAEWIAGEYPELLPRLPEKRKIWLPEHPNMTIFDATALALTFFSLSGWGLRRKTGGVLSWWQRLGVELLGR